MEFILQFIIRMDRFVLIDLTLYKVYNISIQSPIQRVVISRHNVLQMGKI